jgi:hypothetical protein
MQLLGDDFKIEGDHVFLVPSLTSLGPARPLTIERTAASIPHQPADHHIIPSEILP